MVVPAVDERDADGCCPEHPDRFQTSETRADHDDVWFTHRSRPPKTRGE
jgi:hypothetical protein